MMPQLLFCVFANFHRQPKKSSCFCSFQDTMAVIADTDGSAARPPLNLPSRPIILSQGGMCVVAGRPALDCTN